MNWILLQILVLCLKILRFVIDKLSDVIYYAIYESRASLKLPPIKNRILLLPATTLATKIQSRDLTSYEVCEAFIDRIKSVNDVTNAVVDNRFDDALAQAQSIDDAINDAIRFGTIETLAESKPFLGVPFTTKDCFAVEGLSYTGGLLKRKKVKADFNADAVQALIKAGAIPLAVTNVSELCMWMESYNKVYGRTNNPYHNGRIPGGSSGGEASNLAAAGSPFGIGSDVGGSIRMPAFFNGIFGHKPSTGLVSNKGQIPGATGIIDTFLSTGPMSRYAADLLPMFKVMLKPSLNLNLKLDIPINLRNIKLYYMKDDGGNPIVSPVNGELIDVQTKVVRKWKECHQGQPEALKLSKMKYSTLMWSNKMSSEPNAPSFAAELTNLDGTEIRPLFELLKWPIRQTNHTLPAIGLALFEKMFAPDQKFIRMADQLSEELDHVLGDNGVLLYPSHSTPAPYHGQPIIKTFNFSYTGIFNVLGNPVTQVPLGLGSWGVPLGIQVVAGRNQDRNCLAVASELERLFGGWVAPS